MTILLNIAKSAIDSGFLWAVIGLFVFRGFIWVWSRTRKSLGR